MRIPISTNQAHLAPDFIAWIRLKYASITVDVGSRVGTRCSMVHRASLGARDNGYLPRPLPDYRAEEFRVTKQNRCTAVLVFLW